MHTCASAHTHTVGGIIPSQSGELLTHLYSIFFIFRVYSLKSLNLVSQIVRTVEYLTFLFADTPTFKTLFFFFFLVHPKEVYFLYKLLHSKRRNI